MAFIAFDGILQLRLLNKLRFVFNLRLQALNQDE
jgi:hypothetical protein